MQITEYLNKRVFLIFLTVMLFFVSGCTFQGRFVWVIVGIAPYNKGCQLSGCHAYFLMLDI